MIKKEEKITKSFLHRLNYYQLFTYVNLIFVYLGLIILFSGRAIPYWLFIIWPIVLLIIRSLKNKRREKERRLTAHRIPFFADSLANALSVGSTLEQGIEQSSYYLRGEFKEAFRKVMERTALGADFGELLRKLDLQYPKTGLRYLISLLEQYNELGIGISPMLKKIAEALKNKETAEEKIYTILAAGSGYAKMSIFVFGLSFLGFGYLLKDQAALLTTPQLKPYLIFFLVWAGFGMMMVMRITSMEYSAHYGLKPYVKDFLDKKSWTIDELLYYCGLGIDIEKWRLFFLFAPVIIAGFVAYGYSLYRESWIEIEIAFFAGIMLGRHAIEYILKGWVEDQLIQAVEIFPDFLQVFVIGLNSGLNSFRAFEFAQESMEGLAPELLRRELYRVKEAILCGEENAKVWMHLAERLPFEAVHDFCEIMVVSPLHGESITKSITQMMASYQVKKLNMIEKKATTMGQMVIPIFVLSAFPLFLFAVFSPLFLKLSGLFK